MNGTLVKPLMTWIEEWKNRFDNSEGYYTAAIEIGLDFIIKNRQELLIEICAKAETLETAREVRHLIKEYILHGK